MKPILLIGQTDQLPLFFKYFEILGIKFQRRNFHGVLSSTDEMVVFEIQNEANLEKAQKMLSPSTQQVYLAFNSKQVSAGTQEAIKKVSNKNSWVAGFFDLSLAPELYLSYMQKMILGQNSGNKDFLLSLNHNLDDIIVDLEGNLEKIKKIHRNVVPKRRQEVKGLTFVNRYSVGEGPGGEFLDFIHHQQKLLLFLSSSPSHVLSSMVLSYFGYLTQKKELNITVMEKFFENFARDMKEFSLDKLGGGESRLKIFTALIDLSTFQCHGLNFGETIMVDQDRQLLAPNTYPFNPEFISQARFQLQLKRGDKLVVASPGLRQNCQDFLDQRPVADFIKTLCSKNSSDILENIFFELKKNLKGGFLPYDATACFIEVDKNAIIQV